MPAGPFASSVGVGRADPEWAALNKVTGVCGEGTRVLPRPKRADETRARVRILFFFFSHAGEASAPRRAARLRARADHAAPSASPRRATRTRRE